MLPKWVDLDRRLTRLQQVPVLLQLLAVNLGPGFDKPLLRLRQFAAQYSMVSIENTAVCSW